MSDATIVFVNFLCADQIEPKARELVDIGRSVVVVDNSGEYRGAGQIVKTRANIGFGPACNRGVETIETEMFCLHNPDVDLDVELIDQLGKTVEQQGGGIAAPALHTPTGIVRNGYGYPSVLRQARTVARLLSNQAGTTVTAASKVETPSTTGASLYQRLRSVGKKRFASAALLVGDVQTFSSVGGFDDRYVLYGEDLDLWHRYSLLGTPGVFRNDLVAEHERGGGSPTGRPVRELLRWAGIETFIQIHRSPGMWRPYRLLHRTAIDHVDDGGKVGELLRGLWQSGRDPLHVAGELRTEFEDGLMVTGAPDG